MGFGFGATSSADGLALETGSASALFGSSDVGGSAAFTRVAMTSEASTSARGGVLHIRSKGCTSEEGLPRETGNDKSPNNLMEIFLEKRAVRQIRLSAADAVEEGDTESLREDILEAFSEEQVEEIERRLSNGDFFEFLSDILDDWNGDDADELFEMLETQLADIGIDLKHENREEDEEGEEDVSSLDDDDDDDDDDGEEEEEEEEEDKDR